MIPFPTREMKKAAWAEFRAAVVRGTLVRPGECSQCQSVRKVQGHHRDYSKPLEVIWLCIRCHRREHLPEGPLPGPCEFRVLDTWPKPKRRCGHPGKRIVAGQWLCGAHQTRPLRRRSSMRAPSRFRAWRAAARLTLVEAAALLGCSWQEVSKIEWGEVVPAPEVAAAIERETAEMDERVCVVSADWAALEAAT